MCRRRRRSSAYVAGVVTEHGATGVGAPGRVHGLGDGRDDDNDASCINSGAGGRAKAFKTTVDGKACQD